jgi:hypothetical protein
MKDMQTSLEKLRTDVAEAALVRDLATEPDRKDLYTPLAEHLSMDQQDRKAAVRARMDEQLEVLAKGRLEAQREARPTRKWLG